MIRNEVDQLPGVASVESDAQMQMVTIQWQQPASWATIRSRMTEIDYAPEAYCGTQNGGQLDHRF